VKYALRAALPRVFVLAALCALAAPASAAQGEQPAAASALQEPHAPADAAQPEHAPNVDIIMPHIVDAPYLELPWFNSEWSVKWYLPKIPPIHIGGMTLDITPTRHVFMLFLASTLCAAVLIGAARAQRKRAVEGKPPRGLSNAIESIVLYLRSEIILPNVGPHGEGYVPYLLTVFFFILFANLLGLVPFGATATSNIAVTATLAVIAFLVVEISGMIALGPAGYMRTIVFWPHDGALPMKLALSLVISPIELFGKFTKPFALAIRLFANMTAGHVIVLAFIGMIFTFGSWFVAPVPAAMAVAIMLLEVLVAFLQAFIFTLLVSVFIGQVRAGAH
jgi:F-type H+-transporting ATPase subunit a